MNSFRLNHKLPLLLALAACLTCSCGKSEQQTAFSNQATKIDAWVTAQLAAHEDYRAVYHDGTIKIVLVEGDGEPLRKGGRLTMDYSGYDFSNASMSASTLFVTTMSEVASAARWSLSDESIFTPATITLGDDDIVTGLALGLEGITAGEECYIIFTGEYGFGKKPNGTIPANAALCYHVFAREVAN